jgi:hypothetical protein
MEALAYFFGAVLILEVVYFAVVFFHNRGKHGVR